MPMAATRSGLCCMTVSDAGRPQLGPADARSLCCLLPACPNGFHAGLGNARVGFPIPAADADPAEAVPVAENRDAAFHCRPTLGSGGQRQTDRMANVEVLTDGTLGGGDPPIG